MSDIVWSINIMLALLLVGVGVTIYWIFTYDEKNPNPITVVEHTSASMADSGRDDTEYKGTRSTEDKN